MWSHIGRNRYTLTLVYLGTSDLSLRMHYSRRTGFILVVMILAADAPLSD